MAACTECGTALTMRNSMPGGRCGRCHAKHLQSSLKPDTTPQATASAVRAREEERRQQALREIRDMVVTTETILEGQKVLARKGVISAECAYGMNVFKEISASVRNIVGGRSSSLQRTMRDARDTVIEELKVEAHRKGANAVIAIDLDYTQVGDGGWNMVLLVGTGTAVVIEDA